jgi:signal peptidase II
LSLFAVVVSAILARLLWTGVRSKVESVAYVFLMGGALGNAIDRLRIGAVIDYIDLHWQGWHWPAFNFADIFVMSGALLLLVTSFGVDRTESQDPR